MTQTVAQLGARALRKLGVAIVAESLVPADTTVWTQEQLAIRAAREIGIPIPQASAPIPLPSVAQEDLVARTMRACGLNPVAFSEQTHGGVTVVAVPEIAARALRLCGINPLGPITGYGPGTEPTVTQTQIATEALIKLEIFDPNETPVATDLAEVVGVVSQVHEVLTRLGIANWAIGAIPLRAELPYVQMVAAVSASTFGKTLDQALYNAGLLGLWQQEMASAIVVP